MIQCGNCRYWGEEHDPAEATRRICRRIKWRQDEAHAAVDSDPRAHISDLDGGAWLVPRADFGCVAGVAARSPALPQEVRATDEAAELGRLIKQVRASMTLETWQAMEAAVLILHPGRPDSVADRQRVEAALGRVMSPDYVATWLAARNPALAGQTPTEAIERGEVKRVLAVIHQMEAGVG